MEQLVVDENYTNLYDVRTSGAKFTSTNEGYPGKLRFYNLTEFDYLEYGNGTIINIDSFNAHKEIELDYLENVTYFEEEGFVFQINTSLISGTNYSFWADNADLTVYWGDGSYEQASGTGLISHDYGTDGIYNISLSGEASRISFWTHLYTLTGDAVVDILTNMSSGLTGINSSWNMFRDADNFITSSEPRWFDDVSGNVTDMSYMFAYADSANPDTGNWNTSSVTDMYAMFLSADSANPDTGNWNTSSVTDMGSMFYFAETANPDVSQWDTSSVTNMYAMFRSTNSANPNTTNWDTSSVTDMNYMFASTNSANPDTGNWNTSSVTDMSDMFRSSTSANPNTTNWDTSSVTDMSIMFAFTDIANPDVSQWDTSSVTTIGSMFVSAGSANPDVSNWDVSSLGNAIDAFDNSNLSTENYDDLLINWAGQSPDLTEGVYLGALNTSYCLGEDARNDTLIGIHSWEITDDGKDCISVDSESPYFTIIPANQTIEYGTDWAGVDFDAEDSLTSVDTWFIDDTTNFTINQTGFLEDATSLVLGTYLINVSVNDSTGNTNSTVFNLNVTKATPNLNLGGTNSTYPNNISILANESNTGDGDLTYNLYINGSLETSGSSIDLSKHLAAGTYEIEYNTTGGTNYTSNSITKTLKVNKGIPSLILDSTPSWTELYGTEITITGSNCPSQLSCNLYRNGTEVSTPDINTLAAGNYEIEYNTTGNENYTSDTVSNTLTINKAIPQLYSSVTSPIEYGTASDYDANESNTGDSDVTYTLNRNGTTIDTGSSVSDTSVLGANYYQYQYTASGGENYTSLTLEDYLTVQEKELNITADNKEKIYGDADPTLTVSYSGFIVGEDETDLDGTLSTDRTVGEDVNTYTITPSGYTSSNYSINYYNGVFNISKRSITIDGDDKSKTYGDSDPALTTTITSGSLQFTDSISGSLDRISGEDVGTYNIVQDTLDISDGNNGNNYDLTYNNGLFTINARPIEITADDKSKTYNEGDPSLTYTLNESLQFTDSTTGSLTRVSGEAVGTYNINQGTLTAGSNYDETFIIGTFTINKATPSLIISGTSPITYGDTTDVSGSGCPTQLTCSLDKSNAVYGAGTETFNYSTAGNENYTSDYTTKDITINKATPQLYSSVTSPITYLNASDYDANESNTGDSDVVYNLTRNGTLIDSGSSVSDTSILGADYYQYQYTASGGENWTSLTLEDYLTVEPSNSSCDVLFNETSPSPPGVSFRVWSNCDTSFDLYRDDALISNDSVQDLTVGTYNFSVLRDDDVNYTNTRDSETFTISESLILVINSVEEDTDDLGADTFLNASVSKADASIEYCKYTVTHPNGTKLIDDVNGTSYEDQSYWLSENFSLSREGDYSYTLNCKTTDGDVDSESGILEVAYDILISPEEYIFSASDNITETNSFNVSLFDNSLASIVYNISSSVEDSGNFTLAHPSSKELDNTDSEDNKAKFLFSINASDSISEGTYNGNISLTNEELNLSYVVSFEYSISPPSGKPVVYDSSGTECTDSALGVCANSFSLKQGETATQSYNIINEGGYNLSQCSPYMSNEFIGEDFYFADVTSFDLSPAGEQSIQISFAPDTGTSLGDYRGYFYVKCNSSNSLGGDTSTEPENRPYTSLQVESEETIPDDGDDDSSSGGGVPSSDKDTSEPVDLGYCGDGICQDGTGNTTDRGESFYNCPEDCATEFRLPNLDETFFNCFDSNNESTCIWVDNFGLLLAFSFISFLVILLILFDYNPGREGIKRWSIRPTYKKWKKNLTKRF